MPSINLDLDFFDHPKTDRLVHLLGRNSEVIPIRLWVVCGRHYSESGKLTGVSAQEIEAKVKWWGKPGVAIDALVKCGFIELVDGTYQVHDWLEHSGHIARYKIRAKAAAKARWDNASMLQASVLDATSNATSNACALHSNCIDKLIDSVPKTLGSAWVFYSTIRRSRGLPVDDPQDAETFLAEMVRADGFTQEQLLAEIKSDRRSRSESLKEFRFRLKKDPSAVKVSRAPKNESRSELAARIARKNAEELKDLP